MDIQEENCIVDSRALPLNEAEELTGGEAAAEPPSVSTKPTPLPKLQLFAVLLIQLAEPITATCIYPFVNQFVRETGVTKGDERRTGYYAGMIESAFFLAECLTVAQWGYLADRFGRRPVLIWGPLGLAIGMFGFGASTQFWSLVVSRCMQGVFNGNLGVGKTVMAEVTDATNIGDAFALLPLSWSLGTTSGPIIGGVFSNPKERFPNTFGKIAYLHRHPYFLPCAVAGFLALISFVVASLTLKETHKQILAKRAARRKRVEESGEYTPLLDASLDRNDYGTSGNTRQDINDSSSTQQNKPDYSIVFSKNMRAIYINFLFLAFIDMCCAVLLPLMYSTSIPNGGLGLDPYHIGLVLTAFGFINAFVQFNVLGPLIRWLGPRKLYGLSFMTYLVLSGIYPVLKWAVQRKGEINGLVVGLMMCQLTAMMLTYMCYGSIHVLIVENVPEGGPLGTVNGVAQIMSSGMRTLAPTFASSMYSLSLTRQLMGGNMIYYVLLGMTLFAISLLRYLPEGRKR